MMSNIGKYTRYGCVIGFIWGIPIPLLILYIDLSAQSLEWSWENIITSFESRPLHWFFLIHPVLFSLFFLSIGIVLDKIDQRSSKILKQLELEASTDGLTGLYNHSEFYRVLVHELERQRRLSQKNSEPVYLSLLMMDLDRFKAINDTYGHQKGDEVLRAFAQVIRTAIRQYDYAFRYGGDEFTILLPGTTQDDAFRLAERIRDKTHNIRIGNRPVTISTGVLCVEGNPEKKMDIISLVREVDEKMYQAKNSGRDCVI